MTETEFQKLYQEAQLKEARGDFVDALNDYLKLAENVVTVKFKWECPASILSVCSAGIDTYEKHKIIAGSADGNVYALTSDGQINKYEHKASGDVTKISDDVTSVFCKDIDGDGKAEIIVGDLDGNVYLLASDGQLKWKWKTGDRIRSIFCEDIDGDGKAEIIAGDLDRNIYFLNSDRKIKWKWKIGDIVNSVFCTDVDGDGEVEIIAGSADSNVYLLNSDGKIKWKCKTGDWIKSVFCADIDDDGKVEVIAGSYSGNIYLLTSDGKIKWIRKTGGIVRSVFCADINSDDRVEVIAGSSDSNVYLLTSDMRIEWKCKIGSGVNSVFCADIDGDDKVEIIVGSNDRNVYVLSIINQSAMHECISQVWAQVEESKGVLELAQSESPYLRGYVLRRLAQSNEAPKLLKAAIHDDEIYVWRSWVKALNDYAELNADEASTMLEEFYQEHDEELRRELRRVIIPTLADLVYAGNKKAFLLLKKLTVTAPDKKVFKDAIYALVELSARYREESFDIFKQLSNIVNDEIRRETAGALKNMFSNSEDDVLIKVRELFHSGCDSKIFNYLSEWTQSTLSDIFKFYYDMATLKDFSRLADVLQRGIDILERSEHWKYADESRITYHSLLQLLKVSSVKDISQARKLLPKFLYDGMLYTEHKDAFYRLEQIIESVSRSEQLKELQDQMLTFNQAIKRIRGAKDYVSEQVKLPFPFYSILDKWEYIVSEASRKIMGGAPISAELASKRLLRESQISVSIRLVNEGIGPANNIRVKLQNTGDFDYVDGDMKTLNVLNSGGAGAEVQFIVMPRRADTLRISAEITFEDVADVLHTTYLGDRIDFIERTVEFEEIENPYSPGGALKEDKVFYGRQDIFDFINSNLSNSMRDGISILCGQRKSGKSSILARVPKEVKPGYIPLYIDVLSLKSRNIFYDLASFIRSELSKKGYEVASPKLSDYDGSPFLAFNEFIGVIVQKLHCSKEAVLVGKEKLLLMIDEFDQLEEKMGEGEQKKEFFGHLRNLAQHRNDVLSFIFAGTHRLREMGSEYQSILFNIGGRYCKVDALSEDEAKALITEPVEGKLEYEDRAVESIINATGCYPYFVQLVCWHLVKQANDKRDNYVSVNAVEDVLKSLTMEATAGGHLQYLWNIFDADAHAVKAIMADALIYQPDQIDFNSLSRTLADAGVELSDKELRAALNTLCREDILKEIGQGEWYKFKFDLMRLWIRANKPPKKTLQEEGF